MDNGESTDNGRGEVRKDYFSMLVNRLQKDIEDLVRIAQKVMTHNIKKAQGSKEHNDQNWTVLRQTIKNETTKIFAMASEDKKVDKFALVSKLMNMRESLQKQIFHSNLYRKLVIWHDLNIQCDEWCHQKVVECINQINEF